MTLGFILKKSVVWACYAFSAIIVIYSLLVILFGDGLGMEPVSVLLFYPLSFTLAFANGIVKLTALKGGTKLLLHFILVTLGLALFIFIPHGGILSSGTAFLVFTMYVVLYAVGAVIYISIAGKNKKKKEKSTEYKKVF